jgi:hypothetical protein
MKRNMIFAMLLIIGQWAGAQSAQGKLGADTTATHEQKVSHLSGSGDLSHQGLAHDQWDRAHSAPQIILYRDTIKQKNNISVRGK